MVVYCVHPPNLISTGWLRRISLGIKANHKWRNILNNTIIIYVFIISKSFTLSMLTDVRKVKESRSMLEVFSGWISFFTTFPYKRKLRKNTVQYNSSYIIQTRVFWFCGQSVNKQKYRQKRILHPINLSLWLLRSIICFVYWVSKSNLNIWFTITINSPPSPTIIIIIIIVVVVVVVIIREFKISRRWRPRKRCFKSEFAFFRSLSRSPELIYFVKCKRTLFEPNS